MKIAPRARRSRGIALILVLCLVGVCSVLGFAMLSTASLQVRVSANSEEAAALEALSDSGMQMAAYYLQNVHAAPAGECTTVAGQTWWAGRSNFSIAGLTGTATVTVAPVTTDVFDVVVTAAHTSAEIGYITRTTRSRFNLARGFGIPNDAAALFNNNVSLARGVRVEDDLRTNGTLWINYGAYIDGDAYATTWAGYDEPDDFHAVSGADANVSPTNSTIRDYRTYQHHGQPHNAKPLPTSLGSVSGTTLSITGKNITPTSDNPRGVWYHEGGELVLNNVKIEGTLLIRNATLRIRGSGTRVTPSQGFPAVVTYRSSGQPSSSGRLLIEGSFNFEGAVYIASDITSTYVLAFGVTGIIDGALLMDTASIYIPLGAQLRVRHHQRASQVTDLSTQVDGLRQLSWSLDRQIP